MTDGRAAELCVALSELRVAHAHAPAKARGVDDIVAALCEAMECVVPESPTQKTSNRYVIKDFVSASARAVIEAKFIRDKDHGKSVSKELHDDIEMYRHHESCDDLVFFVYDPDSLIPDVGALKRSLEVPRTYGDRALRVHLIVRP